MSDYLKRAHPSATPQSEPIPGSTQTLNEAGGYTWDVDAATRLQRWLILGSEGGAYYASEAQLTRENVNAVLAALKEDGLATVQTIVDVSKSGRAPKNDQAIFALAVCATEGDAETKQFALRAMPEVCRIGTHLFQFCEYVQEGRGWGRTLRRAVAAWYEQKDADDLAYQMVKYRQRNGWTHRDVIRLCHPKAPTPQHAQLYDFACDRSVEGEMPAPLFGYFAMLAKPSAKTIRKYRLPREAIDTDLLTDLSIWEALLEDMPMTAMIRNLATMTRNGLLTPGAESTKRVTAKLGDQEYLHKARIHPMNVLVAQLTYASGQGLRGSNTWKPVTSIVDALDEAFYLCFQNVEPTGKRLLVGLDSSGSMEHSYSGNVGGIPGLTPKLAGVAMSLILVSIEDDVEFMAYDTSIKSWPLSKRMRLDGAMRSMPSMGGGTDCSLPMVYAINEKRTLDGIISLTDSESWAGSKHATQVLTKYRREAGVNTRYAEVGMVAYGRTTVDPDDPAQMKFVGFDTVTPQLVHEFVGGKF